MRMDKLTSKFQLAVSDAQSLAVGNDNQFIEPIHVLMAMLQQQGSSVAPLLGRAGVQAKSLQQDLESAIQLSLIHI